MYQFSRAIYRELATDDHRRRAPCASGVATTSACCAPARPRRAARHRPALLRAAGAHAVQRHPALLPDVARRPGSARRRRATSTLADECLARQPITATTSTASRCSAARRRARAPPCQRMPLPHNGYCPSHQHLAETEEPARRRSPRVAPALGSRSRPSAGVGSRRDAAGSRRRRDVHRRRPRRRRPAGHGQGADDAGRPVRGRAGRRRAPRWSARARDAARGRGVRARHDRGDERAARGRGRAHGAASPPRASRTSSSSAARRAPTSTACAPRARRRSCRPSGASARPSAWRPTAPLRALDDDGRGASRRGRRRSSPRQSPSCLLHAYRHPEHERALGDGAARARCRTCTSRSRTRSSARSASTSAPRRPRSTPRSRRCSARYLRAAGRPRAARPACREPAIMQSSGGLADPRAGRRPRRADGALRPRGRRRRRPRCAAARRGERRRAVLRHGRHVAATSASSTAARCARPRGREVGGRPLALPMLDIHTVGAGGGSIAWRDAGGALRVGPRSAGADPGPAVLRPAAATEPTVTDANLAARPPGATARWPAASRSTAARPSAPSGRSASGSASTCEPAPRASCASRTPRWCARCGS